MVVVVMVSFHSQLGPGVQALRSELVSGRQYCRPGRLYDSTYTFVCTGTRLKLSPRGEALKHDSLRMTAVTQAIQYQRERERERERTWSHQLYIHSCCLHTEKQWPMVGQ